MSFCLRSVGPESLFLQSLEEQKKPKHSSDSSLEVVPVTPDVDLLLQCSFSYMHQAEESERQEQHLFEKPEASEDLLSPIGPEEDKEEVGLSSSFIIIIINIISIFEEHYRWILNESTTIQLEMFPDSDFICIWIF